MKVFVGVSGGVDSSVAAALLKNQGHEVVGVFIRTWQPEWIECTWRDERRDAMRVCAHLGIPFVELNLEEEYKKGVADYMIDEYRKGRTPNPDVMCNREVKFGGFLAWARKQGGVVATGHYARVAEALSFGEGASPSGRVCLLKGVDPAKDQSYFLWTLTSDQLQDILFPVGHLQKSEVRKLAEKYRLPTAVKKDSQGICFIGDIDMKEFLSHYIDVTPGDVLDTDGAIIGRHDGALFYTLGERHGFVITQKGTHDAPYYVVAKDIGANTVTVSHKPAERVPETACRLESCVWRTAPVAGKEYRAAVRYHGREYACFLSGKVDGTAALVFKQFDTPLAQGQSVVVYDGNTCIGGGVVA
jgi:tRNA-specific 2-thiouridylase